MHETSHVLRENRGVDIGDNPPQAIAKEHRLAATGITGHFAHNPAHRTSKQIGKSHPAIFFGGGAPIDQVDLITRFTEGLTQAVFFTQIEDVVAVDQGGNQQQFRQLLQHVPELVASHIFCNQASGFQFRQ